MGRNKYHMTAELQTARRAAFIRLTVLCTVVYFVSYISRINLSATMVELVRSGFAPENTVALALSICSVTYGAGQILSGWLGDRFRPQSVIFIGFLITSAMNLSVAFLSDPGLLCAIWAMNGFAQALMWPPLLAILTKHLNAAEYAKACMWVSWGSSFGTIAVYALSPVIISLFSYRHVFITSGLAALIMSVVWKSMYTKGFTGKNMLLPDDEPIPAGDHTAVKPAAQPFTRTAVFLMAMVMLGIVMQGALRDGVSNWMPTLVSETFSLDSSVSILTGVFLPVFHIICTNIASRIYRRFIRNELTCSGLIFAVGFAAALLLAVLRGSNVIVTVILLAVLVGCMHGVNLMLICQVPPHFRKFGQVSLVSGILNSSTYIGSAISTYVIALFSGAFGWGSTLYMWAAIAAAGMLICLGFAGRWKAFTE